MAMWRAMHGTNGNLGATSARWRTAAGRLCEQRIVAWVGVGSWGTIEGMCKSGQKGISDSWGRVVL